MSTPRVERTSVIQIITAELLTLLSSSGITLIGPNEPAPDPSIDKTDAVAPGRWCKLYWPALSPMSSSDRSADCKGVAMTVAVGTGQDEINADPLRLSKDIDTVIEALTGLRGTQDSTGHIVELTTPDDDIMEQAGEHANSKIGVITITGIAERIVDPA